jgi:hypothetical protein
MQTLWRRILAQSEVDALYSTQFKRTRKSANKSAGEEKLHAARKAQREREERDRRESIRYMSTVYKSSALRNKYRDDYDPAALTNTGAVYSWWRQTLPKRYFHVSLFPGQNGRGFHITADSTNKKKTHWFFRNDGSYRYSQIRTKKGPVQIYENMPKNHSRILDEAKVFAKFLANRRRSGQHNISEICMKPVR